MKSGICDLKSLLLVFLLPIGVVSQSTSENLPDLVKLVEPAVVTVNSFDGNGKLRTRGSGFFVAPGVVVTNWHVVASASRISLIGARGQSYDASVNQASDSRADLAILNASRQLCPGHPLYLATALPDPGETVFVIGSPLGFLGGSVTNGIISAVRPTEFGPFIQMTAAISQGSSGSPVVNMSGQVIGVATLQFTSGQSLNFAISSTVIEKVLARAKIPINDWSPFEFVLEPIKWTPAASGIIVNYEYDPQSIVRLSEGTFRVSLRVSPNKEGLINGKARAERVRRIRSAGYSTAGYEQWSHSIVRDELDCSGLRLRILGVTDYDQFGCVLNSLGSDPRSWQSVSTDSVTREIIRAVCRDSGQSIHRFR